MSWSKAKDWLIAQPAGKGRDFLLRIAERKAGRAKPKAPRGAASVRSLTHKLDDVFSRYIRLRDRLAPTSDACACVTCGRFAEWQAMDCGHFMSRGFMVTRWNEKNCAAQCRSCNRFKEGMHSLFAKALDSRWGPGTSDKLVVAARLRRKFAAFELEAMIKHYGEIVRGLAP